MPSHSKKRTSSAYRGNSHHKVCVMTATDSQDNMLFEISGFGSETMEMVMNLKDRFEDGSTLITDSKRSFDKFASETKMNHNYISSYITVLIDNIYNGTMHFNLKDAYAEYKYGIFA